MTGLELTLAALRTHLAAVAWPRYEVRLIDSAQRACCATRYWTAGQLLAPTTARFLRARNRAGCEVYFRPHAGADSAGYLLLDFDAGPGPASGPPHSLHRGRNQSGPPAGLAARQHPNRQPELGHCRSSWLSRALWSRSG